MYYNPVKVYKKNKIFVQVPINQTLRTKFLNTWKHSSHRKKIETHVDYVSMCLKKMSCVVALLP